MNYLDMTNSVLRRLREDQVSSLYQNRLSALVAEYINDAKRIVENAHDWSALRTDISLPTAQGTNVYTIPDSQNRITVKDVRNTTSNCMLSRVTSEYIRRQDLINNPGETQPSYWALEGTASNGDSQIKFWPVPDGTYVIKVNAVQRTADLVAEGDETSIPDRPITLLAYAMAAEERGETGSSTPAALYGRAKRVLADEIMLDAAKNPEEMIWTPV